MSIESLIYVAQDEPLCERLYLTKVVGKIMLDCASDNNTSAFYSYLGLLVRGER